ncbi:MAG: DUF6497 family protein [Pseudomonadota bacterium]
MLCGIFALFCTVAHAEQGRPPAVAALPSGQDVTPLDMAFEIQPDGQTWLILRYLAPRIARDTGDLGYAAVAPDLDALCDAVGRPAVADAASAGQAVDQVVVILRDRPGERGVFDPAATAFISAYRLGQTGCMWQ